MNYQGQQVLVPHWGGVTPWYRAGGAPAPVGAYQAKSVGSYAASLVNLANPGTNNLTEGNGAVTWSTTAGWQFNSALSKFFDTGLVANQNWTLLVQYADYVSGLNDIISGCTSGGNTRLYVGPQFVAGSVRYAHGASLDVAPILLAGNLAVAGAQGYRNGIADGGAIGAWVGVNTRSVYIGGLNNNGVLANTITGNIYAVAIYNVVLSAPQVAAVATAMAGL